MDIKKEREAFDLYFKEKYPELYNDVFDEDGDDRAIIGYSFALSAWQAVKSKAVSVCVWVGIYDGSVFESSCGHTFELSNDGTLDDNNMKHCCFCGGKIEAQEQSHD